MLTALTPTPRIFTRFIRLFLACTYEITEFEPVHTYLRPGSLCSSFCRSFVDFLSRGLGPSQLLNEMPQALAVFVVRTTDSDSPVGIPIRFRDRTAQQTPTVYNQRARSSILGLLEYRREFRPAGGYHNNRRTLDTLSDAGRVLDVLAEEFSCRADRNWIKDRHCEILVRELPCDGNTL